MLGVRVGDKFSVQSLAFGGWDFKFRVEAWGGRLLSFFGWRDLVQGLRSEGFGV